MAKHCYFALFFDKSYNLVLFFTLFRLCRFDWCCRSSDWTTWAGSLWSLSPGSLSPQSPALSSCCASPTKTLLSLEPLGGMRSGLASTSAGIFDFFLLPLSGHGQVLRSVVQLLVAQCVKGGGAKKMLQTAKTFVTKLVRYIEWIVDPLRGHQFYLIWYCYGQKRPFFWPKPPFLAMRGSRRPRWLAKVDQMVDHS